MNLNEGLLVYMINSGYTDWFYPLFILFILITIAAAYLLGSINSAIIISKIFYNDDIRRHGSGNAGLTNMLRTYGAFPAVMTLIGDILKTVIAIFIAAFFFGFWHTGGVSTGDGFCYIAALFAVLGHVFPIYYKFKGGKGVLTLATAALMLSPIPFLILFFIFVIIVLITKYVSLASVTSVVLYPVVMSTYFKIVFTGLGMPGIASLSLIILAILIVWCHRENLKRISERKENKLSFGKKKKADTVNDENGKN